MWVHWKILFPEWKVQRTLLIRRSFSIFYSTPRLQLDPSNPPTLSIYQRRLRVPAGSSFLANISWSDWPALQNPTWSKHHLHQPAPSFTQPASLRRHPTTSFRPQIPPLPGPRSDWPIWRSQSWGDLRRDQNRRRKESVLYLSEVSQQITFWPWFTRSTRPAESRPSSRNITQNQSSHHHTQPSVKSKGSLSNSYNKPHHHAIKTSLWLNLSWPREWKRRATKSNRWLFLSSDTQQFSMRERSFSLPGFLWALLANQKICFRPVTTPAPLSPNCQYPIPPHCPHHPTPPTHTEFFSAEPPADEITCHPSQKFAIAPYSGHRNKIFPRPQPYLLSTSTHQTKRCRSRQTPLSPSSNTTPPSKLPPSTAKTLQKTLIATTRRAKSSPLLVVSLPDSVLFPIAPTFLSFFLFNSCAPSGAPIILTFPYVFQRINPPLWQIQLPDVVWLGDGPWN